MFVYVYFSYMPVRSFADMCKFSFFVGVRHATFDRSWRSNARYGCCHNAHAPFSNISAQRNNSASVHMSPFCFTLVLSMHVATSPFRSSTLSPPEICKNSSLKGCRLRVQEHLFSYFGQHCKCKAHACASSHASTFLVLACSQTLFLVYNFDLWLTPPSTKSALSCPPNRGFRGSKALKTPRILPGVGANTLRFQA